VDGEGSAEDLDAVLEAGQAAVAVRISVAESPIYSRGRIDWLGAALLASALGALMLAISEGNAWGWGSFRVVALFAGAAVLAGAWVARERHAANPLVDLRVQARGPIWRANVSAFAIGSASLIPFALVPLIAGYPESTGYGLA
jgi:hypothetical protein